VGVSGGADSSVLLWAVSKTLETVRDSRPLFACHLNHNLRSPSETEVDAEAVRTLSRRLGATLVEDAVPAGFIEKRARTDGGLEAAARRVRYTFFARVASEYGASAILLGHHEDDQIETLLMRLLNGGDPASFSGIPEDRPLEAESACRVLRPFLTISKEEILLTAKDLGLKYAVDATNASLDALRNRVRALIVPRLSEIQPEARSRMQATRRRGRMLRSFLDREIDGFPWERQRTEEGMRLSVSVAALAEVHPYVRLHLLIAAFNEIVDGSQRRVSERFLAPLLIENLRSVDDFKADAFGVAVTLTGGIVTLSKSEGAHHIEGFCFVKEVQPEQNPGISVSCRVKRHEVGIHLAAEGLLGPVVLRSRRPGDVLEREGGRRTVKRILIDIGVPSALRESVPIVEDRSGVVAVLGAAVGAEDVLRYNVRHGQASVENVIFSVNQE
jgi:tRNA(Ile)-lysidine synthetase-like protein